jgi:predicted SnoaL-like aldol condensation-catalyzing enzyme
LTEEQEMAKATAETNKALVLEAFDTLFNKRDYEAAERFWSPKYIQHSAHIKPGRGGLFDLIKSLPASLRYEHGLILAEGDYVILMAASRAMAAPPPGSPRTSFGSRTASWPSIGTCFRTKRQSSNPSAGCRCSATVSLPEICVCHRGRTAGVLCDAGLQPGSFGAPINSSKPISTATHRLPTSLGNAACSPAISRAPSDWQPARRRING